MQKNHHNLNNRNALHRKQRHRTPPNNFFFPPRQPRCPNVRKCLECPTPSTQDSALRTYDPNLNPPLPRPTLASHGGDGPLHEIPDEAWQQTMDLNLTGLFYSNRAAVRQFLAQGTAGSILNMGSVLGFSPSPKFFATHAYAAAKSAVVGFTKACAAYYA